MRIQNTPFGSHPFKRSVAIIIAALFLSTQLLNGTPAVFAASTDLKVQGGSPSGLNRLAGDPEIRIPPELGSVDEVYRVSRTTDNEPRNETHGSCPVSQKFVVFIQDAHDSLEAQENIAKIINHMVSNYGVKTVFEEGYEGPVPTDKYFGFIKDAKIREKVSYFLMDHLRIGGAEYAHINRAAMARDREMGKGERETIRQAFPVPRSPKSDWQLIGADSVKLHLENIAQYGRSAERNKGIHADLAVFEKELKSLADGRFPRPLKAWLKTKEEFDAKKLDLFTYLARTLSLLGTRDTAHEPRQNPTQSAKDQAWPVARGSWPLMEFILEAVRTNDPAVIEKAKHIDAREVFGELLKLEQAIAGTYLHDAVDKQLFEYYQILKLLNRLDDLQVSQEEYEAVKAGLKAFDTDSFASFIFSQAPKTLILSRLWERNIKEAIKFYEIAKARDHSLENSLDQYFPEGRNAQRTTQSRIVQTLSFPR